MTEREQGRFAWRLPAIWAALLAVSVVVRAHGDWHGLAYYGALLLYGAFIFGSPALPDALNRQRWL
jgi:hypothetical protein